VFFAARQKLFALELITLRFYMRNNKGRLPVRGPPWGLSPAPHIAWFGFGGTTKIQRPAPLPYQPNVSGSLGILLFDFSK
jgi:hypothetical protein